MRSAFPCLDREKGGEEYGIGLAYTESMTGSRQTVDDAQFARPRQYFDDVGLIELTALIAFQNMSSKFRNIIPIRGDGS